MPETTTQARPPEYGAASGSPVHYVLCSCANCGWTDGFREDCISGQRVDGYCDNCDEPREFRVIEENKALTGFDSKP